MLKNILSLLLSKFYSKEESELVGHQAMPSTQNVALTPTTTSIDDWGAVYTGVAPTDGFACIRFTADTTTCLASAQSRNVNVFTTPQAVGDVLLCACPIAKGQDFTLCARQAKNIKCWFTKTIGGGYQALKNALLQGGVLCRLSRLYSSLRRSSCRVRRNGWQSNRQFLRAIQSRSLLLPTEKTITSQCPAQGTPTCAVMVFGLSTLTGASSLTSGLMRTGISASIYTPKRVNSLDMLWGLVPNSLRLISIFTRPKAVSNLVVGGASC